MSTPEVTITLGRSGQVVKRKRADFEGSQFPSYHSSSTARFGSKLNSSYSSHNKRQRDVAVKKNVRHVGENGLHLDRNDLRHKLIKRRRSSESHIVISEQRAKLKEKFSGAPARSSISSNALTQSQREMIFQRDPYREASGDLSYMHSLRNYYSTMRRDEKQKSPVRPTYNSGCLSPPEYKTEMHKVTSIRSMDPLGSRHAFSNSLLAPPRPTVPAHTMRLTESERAKPVALFPPPSGSMPKSLFMADAPVTVAGLLNSLGLGKYAIPFQAEEVDITALKQMGEKDLKDLGIPMGPRKKILQALTVLSRRQLPRQL